MANIGTIRIKSLKKYEGYNELSLEIVVPIPTSLIGLANKKEIADSYSSQYVIERITEIDVYFSKVMSFESSVDNSVILATLSGVLANYQTNFQEFQTVEIDELTGMTFDGTDWTYIAPTPVTNTSPL
jgi:hypothetical protein